MNLHPRIGSASKRMAVKADCSDHQLIFCFLFFSLRRCCCCLSFIWTISFDDTIWYFAAFFWGERKGEKDR